MEHTQLCRLSHCLERIPEVPRWCLALAGELIVAGLGMIENDFHTGFYERYGWEFFCTVQQEGEPQPTRVYRHRAAPAGKQE